MNNEIKTAVLLLIFNRPDTTKEVFESIRRVRPLRLYVAADGPRKDLKDELEKIEKTRYIATAVDWPCQVKTLFRNENLGCKIAVSSAITWFFEHENQGIILEDDCVAHSDFFHFCENLLDYYSQDERLFVITGNNFQQGKKYGNGSYYFSKYNHCWGWATWRRAWEHYQGELPFWKKWQKSQDWLQKTPDKIERKYWQKIFERVYRHQLDSWAYPWTASVWYAGGLTVTPNTNLVSNIGFGIEATHTTLKKSNQSKIPVYPLGNLVHPSSIEQNKEADHFVFNQVFGGYYLRFPWILLSTCQKIIKLIYKYTILRHV